MGSTKRLEKYIYIYIYIYICVCVCVEVCLCISMFVHICMPISTYVNVYCGYVYMCIYLYYYYNLLNCSLINTRITVDMYLYQLISILFFSCICVFHVCINT